MAARYAMWGNPGIDPFAMSTEPARAFEHPAYRRARAYLRYALNRGEGIVLVTGAPGTGKTLLLNDLLGRCSESRTEVIVPPGVRLSPHDIRSVVADSLGVSVQARAKAAQLLRIREALIARRRKGQRVALAVDEAHGLSHGAFEELRALGDLQHGGTLLLQLFMVGQESLLDLIRNRDHLRQRITAAARLQPLSIAETADYVAWRMLHAATHRGVSMTWDAVEAIHAFSGGVPRRINLIGSRLLVMAAVEGWGSLDRDAVEALIEALRDEMPFAHGGVGEADRAPASGGSDRARRGPANDAEPNPSDTRVAAQGAAPGVEGVLNDAVVKSNATAGAGELVTAHAGCSSPCQDGSAEPAAACAAARRREPKGQPASRARQESGTGTAVLRDLSGTTGRDVHVLSGARIRIGRRSHAGDTAGPGIYLRCVWVSRNHALIERQQHGYSITDLGSINGTYVNDERIAGQRRLRDGDTIRVARYEFRFSCAMDLLRSA